MSKTVVNVILMIVSIGLAVSGQLAMKAGMNKVGEIKSSDFKHLGNLIMRVLRSFWAVAGIILYAVSALFWLVVLSRVALSVAYPIVAGGYVIVVLYSRFVFKEEVRPIAWVGLALIVVGVIITAQGLKSKDDTGAGLKPAAAVHAQAQIEPASPESEK